MGVSAKAALHSIAGESLSTKRCCRCASLPPRGGLRTAAALRPTTLEYEKAYFYSLFLILVYADVV
jgi:hypothetical protein